MPIDPEKVKAIREKRGLTMLEAAQAAEYKTLQAWSEIERGTTPDPRLSTVERVARALGCKVQDLLRS